MRTLFLHIHFHTKIHLLFCLYHKRSLIRATNKHAAFTMYYTRCTHSHIVAHACLLQKESRCDYHHHIIIALSIHLLAHTYKVNYYYVFFVNKTRGSKLVRICSYNLTTEQKQGTFM